MWVDTWGIRIGKGPDPKGTQQKASAGLNPCTQYTGHMAHSCQPSAPEADIGGSGPSLKITTKQLVQKEQADCSVGLATKLLRARVGRGCVYSLLQDLAVGGLRVAEVHELIQQLINDNKVVSDALLLQLLKVLREDLHHLVEEGEY